MKKLCLGFLFILSIFSAIAQTLPNYHKAFGVLNKSIDATGKDVTNSIAFSAKGTIYNLGHYDTPEKVRQIPVEESYAYFSKENVNYSRSSIQNNGNVYFQSAIGKNDSVYSMGYYDRTFIVSSDAQEFKFKSALSLPIKLLQFAYENRQSLRYIGSDKDYEWLTFSYKPNESVTLYISKKTNLLDAVERLAYSDLYGDAVFKTEYKNYVLNKGTQFPGTRTDTEYGIVERELAYSDLRMDAEIESFDFKLPWLPKAFQDKLPAFQSHDEVFSTETLAPGLDLIKLTSRNNKVLVAQFKDYIALFESPSGLELGQRILGEIQKNYPSKPLHYVFVTHHHPDHAGSIRAFAPLPMVLVTTQGNEVYFKKLLATTHTLGTSATQNKGLKLQMDFVPLEGQKSYKDEQMEVTAYEIGKATAHTNEHLVYYFPQVKILWTGDLLFFREDEKIFPAGDRGKSVYDFIQKHNLAVDKIYTSWPLNGQSSFGTVAELKKAVDKR